MTWLLLLMLTNATARPIRVATALERQPIEAGLLLRQEFLDACRAFSHGSSRCDEVIRPNPSPLSRDIFARTYGPGQPHVLIHPDRKTWIYAFTAVQIVQELEAMGVHVAEIYNWWRPEPYNGNVDGTPLRHPFATSVDVHFATKEDQERAFAFLCHLRDVKRIRAVGYYSTTALHIGVGDERDNFWGKTCPTPEAAAIPAARPSDEAP